MNDKKNDVEVVINNKIYTICGFESEEYIQKIASYINAKYSEFKNCEGYNSLNNDMRNIMLHINLADDYFKALKQSDEYLSESDDKNKELFEIKHEIISYQTKNDSLRRELEQLKDEMSEEEKRMIRLEAELEECKRQLKSVFDERDELRANANSQNKPNGYRKK